MVPINGHTSYTSLRCQVARCFFSHLFLSPRVSCTRHGDTRAYYRVRRWNREWYTRTHLLTTAMSRAQGLRWFAKIKIIPFRYLFLSLFLSHFFSLVPTRAITARLSRAATLHRCPVTTHDDAKKRQIPVYGNTYIMYSIILYYNIYLSLYTHVRYIRYYNRSVAAHTFRSRENRVRTASRISEYAAIYRLQQYDIFDWII